MRNVDFPFDQQRMENFRPLLERTLGGTPDLTSATLPLLAGAEITGQAHSALHDCEAIRAALAAWRAQGMI